MPKNRDLQSLIDIEKAANKATQFLQSAVNKAAFIEDDKTQSAVIFQLLIIGEATKRRSKTLREINTLTCLGHSWQGCGTI